MPEAQLLRAPTAPPRPTRRHPLRWLLPLTLAVCGLFLCLDAQLDSPFVLRLRAFKLLSLVVVACAIAGSSVVFQTITHNRLLTPTLLGLDALYVLLHSALSFAGAATAGKAHSPAWFLVEMACMIGFTLTLHWFWFLRTGARDLHHFALAGVLLGSLFRSSSSLLQRLLDPNEFAVLQDRLFASFNRPEPRMLWFGAALTCGGLLALRLRSHRLDVVALGRDPAIALGLNYRREVSVALLIIAALVSISTALVGPVTFFGLLVASATYALVDGARHRELLPVAMAVGVLLLVGAQTLLERVLHFDANVRVLLEFCGGILFLFHLLRRKTP